MPALQLDCYRKILLKRCVEAGSRLIQSPPRNTIFLKSAFKEV